MSCDFFYLYYIKCFFDDCFITNAGDEFSYYLVYKMLDNKVICIS